MEQNFPAQETSHQGLESSLKQQVVASNQFVSSSEPESPGGAPKLRLIIGGGVMLLALGIGTYFGLDFFLNRSTAQTYQQCVAEGGLILETFPEQCQTKDGRLFTAPLADEGEEPADQLSAKDREIEAAYAQGKDLYFQDELGLKVTVPQEWNGYAGNVSTASASLGYDFLPAVKIWPPDANAQSLFNTITISVPVSIAGPHIGRGTMAANGLSGLKTAMETAASPDLYQLNQISDTQLFGQPAVLVRRQFAATAPNQEEVGICPGCWQKMYFYERNNSLVEVGASWRANDGAFEEEFDRILQSVTLQ